SIVCWRPPCSRLSADSERAFMELAEEKGSGSNYRRNQWGLTPLGPDPIYHLLRSRILQPQPGLVPVGRGELAFVRQRDVRRSQVRSAEADVGDAEVRHRMPPDHRAIGRDFEHAAIVERRDADVARRRDREAVEPHITAEAG